MKEGAKSPSGVEDLAGAGCSPYVRSTAQAVTLLEVGSSSNGSAA